MTMRLEILADTPQEFAVKLAGVAQIFMPNMRFVPAPADEAKTGEAGTPVEPPNVENQAEKPAEKPARKPRGAAAKKAEPPAEKPVEPDAPKAPEEKADESPKELTFEEVKNKAIKYASDFAEKNPTDKDARYNAFKGLLAAFKIEKFGELPADKLADMNALVDEKVAALAAL